MLKQVPAFLYGRVGMRKNFGISHPILAARIIPPHGSTWEAVHLFLRRNTGSCLRNNSHELSFGRFMMPLQDGCHRDVARGPG